MAFGKKSKTTAPVEEKSETRNAAPKTGAKKKKSRFAGAKASRPQTPLLDVPGDARLRFLGAEQTYNEGNGNETVKCNFEIVAVEGKEIEAAFSEGDKVQVLHVVSGPSGRFAIGRYKSLVMALGGYEDEETFDQDDPDGELLDALIGEDNDAAATAAAFVGRLVDVGITRGKPILDKDTKEPTGEYYANHNWEVVDEDDQDQKADWL